MKGTATEKPLRGAGKRPTQTRPAKKAKKKLWELRLYVAGQTPKSLAAFANLKAICEEHLPGCYAIEVIDLYKRPALADGEQIIAAPTLLKKLPLPLRRFIGDMSNTEKIIVGLDLRPKAK